MLRKNNKPINAEELNRQYELKNSRRETSTNTQSTTKTTKSSETNTSKSASLWSDGLNYLGDDTTKFIENPDKRKEVSEDVALIGHSAGASFTGHALDWHHENENSQSIQENSMSFASPYKSEEQLEKLHIKQLVTTWEAIRVGEFNYLLHQAPPGGSVNNNNSDYSGRYSGTNQEIVWQFFTNNGFSKETTAGIMGNIEHESGFITDKIEAGSGIGFGIIQWSYTRRDALEARAAKDNRDVNDLHFQLEYCLEEMSSGDYWMANNGYSFAPYNYPYNEFITKNDIEWSTNAFCWMFERPDETVARIDKRISAANEYYNEFKDATFSSGTYTGDATGLAKALIQECYKYEGLGYSQQVRYGPTYDCSSLMEVIYRDVAGVNLGTWTGEQVSKHNDPSFGIKVSVADARPGDLFYYFEGSTSIHVSMHVGNGAIFHAATPALGILFQDKDNMHASYAFRIAALM